MEELKTIIYNLFISLVICIIIFLSLVGIISLLNGSLSTKTSSPVEESINIIDSLTVVNDSIENNISKLDSIKDVEVIEVKTLGNDSTLKLFYKLIK